MSKARILLRAIRHAIGKNAVNAGVGAAAGAGLSAATGGDDMQSMALSGAIIGANARALRKIGIDVARSRRRPQRRPFDNEFNDPRASRAVSVGRNEMDGLTQQMRATIKSNIKNVPASRRRAVAAEVMRNEGVTDAGEIKRALDALGL